MKKGIEILKEVYFTVNPYHSFMVYSEKYSYMQVLVDWDKREIRTFLKSTWNSSFDVNKVLKF